MTLNDIQTTLAEIVTDNPDILNASAKVRDYSELFKDGKITKEEYKNLLLDIQSQIEVQKNMADLKAVNTLNEIISICISITAMANLETSLARDIPKI
jgi:polyhydroxyalkanoate synthesis regulator phasin